jgi:hypothetical protein
MSLRRSSFSSIEVAHEADDGGHVEVHLGWQSHEPTTLLGENQMENKKKFDWKRGRQLKTPKKLDKNEERQLEKNRNWTKRDEKALKFRRFHNALRE